MNTRPLLGALVAALVVTTSAQAGWFGPSTYDECILDEMKGRPACMMETVKRDCTAKFCTEVPVPPITEERKAALTAAAKKIADKCKSDAEAFPNYYTRLDAGLCRRPSPTARRPVSFAIKRPP